MKRMIGLALAASLVPCGRPVSGQVADSLTVEQAIRQVIGTHPAVQEAMNGVSASEARVRERETAFSPNVSAEGTYSRVGPVPTLELDNRAFALFPSDNYNADVSLRHTLYDAGRRETAVAGARAQETLAGDNVDVVKWRLAFQTVDAFYGVLFLRRSLEVQDQEIEALTQHLQITQGRVQAGAATDFDVLSTQVRIATARSQRVDLADALAERTIELRQLLGLPRERTVEPVGDFQADTLSADPDSLVALAMEQRPDVRSARNAEPSTRARTELASLGDKPSLNLNLSVGAKNGYVPNLNRIKPDFVAGMAVQLPVYNGNRTRTEVQASQADESTARSHTEVLERSVATDVEKAVAAVSASGEKIRTSDVQLRQATAALDLARTRYEAGVVTNLDVLDAETLLSQARLVQLRARYDLVRSRYRLQQAIGQKIW
jgi:outer membrane protein